MNLVEVFALKKFQYSEDGIAIKQAQTGDAIRVPETSVAGMKAAGMIDDRPPAPTPGSQTAASSALGAPPAARQDGPTIEEYVKAGYALGGYPPEGYAEKASPGLEQYKATGKLALKVKGNKYLVFDAEKQLTKDPVSEDEAKALFAPKPTDPPAA